MKKRLTWRIPVAALAVSLAAHSLAAEDPKHLKDLTSVVALLGVPCGQVVRATRINDTDHFVTCQDGNRYRVYLNAEGRVVAQKQ